MGLDRRRAFIVLVASAALSAVSARGGSAGRDSDRAIPALDTPVAQSNSAMRTLSGIRVLYRLRVKPGHEERFRDAWKRVTEAALRRAPGARGSLLARTREAPDVFLAVARWESHEQWRTYRQGPALDAAAVADLNGTSELISYEVIDEVADIGRP